MKIEHLDTYLKAQGIDWPIVAHELPTAPDRCIAIRKYSGIPGRLLNDDLLPADDQPRFQILTRDPDDLTAEAKADELCDLLHVSHGVVGGARTFRLQAEQRPVLMMRDGNHRYVYVFNASSWVLR